MEERFKFNMTSDVLDETTESELAKSNEITTKSVHENHDQDNSDPNFDPSSDPATQISDESPSAATIELNDDVSTGIDTEETVSLQDNVSGNRQNVTEIENESENESRLSLISKESERSYENQPRISNIARNRSRSSHNSEENFKMMM